MSSYLKKIPLFDIDWTLLEGANSIHDQAFDYAFKQIFNSNRSKKDLETEGKIDTQIIVEVLKQDSIDLEVIKAKMPQVIKTMSEYFLEHYQEGSFRVLSGVKELLENLDQLGFLMGLLTGNIQTIALKKLKDAGIRKYFSFGAYGDQAQTRVELVKIVRQRVEKYLGSKVSLGQLAIVGDSLLDVKCAKDAGIKCIAVASGRFDSKQLKNEGANLVVESLQEKEKIIDFLR